MAITTETVPAVPARRRLAVSAMPSGARPRWVRWVLPVLLAGTAVLYCWNVTGGGYSDYYAMAVKSMSVSWKAFFFGAFDPQATVTLDKLAGFLIPQALSARIFGLAPHPWRCHRSSKDWSRSWPAT